MAVKFRKTVQIGEHKYRLMSKHGKKMQAAAKKSKLEQSGYSVRLIDNKASSGVYLIYARKHSAPAHRYSGSNPRAALAAQAKSIMGGAQSKRDMICKVSAGVMATKSQTSKRRKFPPSPRKIKKYKGVSKKAMSQAGALLRGYCAPTAKKPKGKRLTYTQYNALELPKREKAMMQADKKARKNLKNRYK